MRKIERCSRQRARWVAIFMAVLFLLAACQSAPTTPEPASSMAPTSNPTDQVVTIASAPDELSSIPSPSPRVEMPESNPTAPAPATGPIRLGAGPGVPQELVEAAQALAERMPADFAWDPAAADAELAVLGDRPLATWVYAVAAPFYTLEDEITWNQLLESWHQGTLYLDQETAVALQAILGLPAREAMILPPGDIVATLWQAQENGQSLPLTILPFHRLSPPLKALRLGGQSPTAVDFVLEGYPLVLAFGFRGDGHAVNQVKANWSGPETNRDDAHLSHIAMTGPAGMRRAVADRMERYGLTYPAEETGPILQAVDIAHMSNENAFAPDCPLPDPLDDENVCNRDEYVELMTWMGIDVNEMTGNHLNDWGSASLLHTFDLYDELGIETYGGGRDLADARKPLLMEHNGNRIAFVGCNPAGPQLAWAKENYPGSLPCDDYSFLLKEIEQLHGDGYVVIATLQYREDYEYLASDEQREIFRSLAEAGAAAVSGSQGHHPQGFAFAGESFIHYGLGNLLADQMWSLETRQSFIDIYTVYDGRLVSVDLWTGLNEDFARIRAMTPGERRDLLQTVFAASDH